VRIKLSKLKHNKHSNNNSLFRTTLATNIKWLFPNDKQTQKEIATTNRQVIIVKNLHNTKIVLIPPFTFYTTEINACPCITSPVSQFSKVDALQAGL
jgi:hypothetical protein